MSDLLVQMLTGAIATLKQKNAEKDAQIATLEVKVAELDQKVENQHATITAMEHLNVRLKQQVVELTYEDNKAHLEKVMGFKPEIFLVEVGMPRSPCLVVWTSRLSRGW